MDWFDNAPCKSLGEVFFPVSESEEAAKNAKSICASCPFKEKCLKFSFENKEEYGIWGGMTPKERKSYLRRIKRNNKVTV